METWRHVWRHGFAPSLTQDGLEALRRALEADDFHITQLATTVPSAVPRVLDWPAEGACAITYCGWHGEQLETVGELEDFFTRVCFEADQRLGEAGASRWFLNWYDAVPREEMRALLLEEIEHELECRLVHVDRFDTIESYVLVGAAA